MFGSVGLVDGMRISVGMLVFKEDHVVRAEPLQKGSALISFPFLFYV